MNCLFLIPIFIALNFTGYQCVSNFFNSPLSIDLVSDFASILTNTGIRSITFTGINHGKIYENQTVNVSVVSNNTDFILNHLVDHKQESTAITPYFLANGSTITTETIDKQQARSNLTRRSFDVTIFNTNREPSFLLSTNSIQLKIDELVVKIKNFAINIDDGDQELRKKLKFITSIKNIDGNLTFKSFPEINDKNGDLKFEINSSSFGEATIGVILRVISNGGTDTSEESIFTIKTYKPSEPLTLNDISSPLTILEDAEKQIVELSGISSDANEGQDLDIFAVSDNHELISNIEIEYIAGENMANLIYYPNHNQFGNANITVTIDNGQSENNTISKQFLVLVNPVADTPAVTDAVVDGNKQTSSGLVISRNPVDGNEVSHFKITEIINGDLFLNDGVSPIVNNAFITFQEGNSGLRFTPKFENSGLGSFSLQAATGSGDANLGGSVITAQIIVVNEPPTLNDIPSPLTILEDAEKQIVELSGISPGTNEGQDLDIFAVSDNHELISNIEIEYIAGDNMANLIYYPNHNRFGNANITVTIDNGQSENNTISKQFLVIVNPVADTPEVTDAVVEGSKQTTSGLVISRNPVDGNEVSHFKITEIINGDLFLNDGVSPIVNNAFITFQEGNMGLKFTVYDGISGPGTFNVQAATGPDNLRLGGSLVTAQIITDNDPPSIISKPDTVVEISGFYNYDIETTDPNENDFLTYTIDIPQSIQLWLKMVDNRDGTAAIFGTPPLGSVGIYNINIKVEDQFGYYDEQQYNLYVNELNNRPELSPFSISIQEDETIFFLKEDFTLRFSDADGDTLHSIKIVNIPQFGTLKKKGVELGLNDEIGINELSNLTYTPDIDYFGLDIFDWNASDGKDYALVPQRLSVFISSVNDPPEINDFESIVFTFEYGDESIVITNNGVVTDVDGDKLEKATVTITKNFLQEEDSLFYEIGNNLSFDWQDTLGILTIQGIELPVIYQDAIRSLRYVNLNRLAPTGDFREIEIVLFDSDTSSITYLRRIEFENTFMELDIPNAFTPNNDMVNDTWEIDNLDRYENCQIEVYSRSGQLIFNSESYLKEWDGRFNGELVPVGTYYYLINLIKFKKVYTGTVLVLR